LLANADPLYVLGVIQASNLMTGWGAYYEPSHSGFESKVELIAGLLLTQASPMQAQNVSDGAMQAIHDELARIVDLVLLRNLSAPRGDDLVSAELRFTGALQWMTMRGSSYAHHGADLALALYSPFDDWSDRQFGFRATDVLQVGGAVEALWKERMNAVLAEGRDFADRIRSYVRSPSAKFTAEERAELGQPASIAQLTGRALIEVFERGVRSATSFTREDLVAAGLEGSRVDAVLGELSQSAGSLDAEAYSGLFDESPLVERPFLEYNGRYMLVVPGMVVRDTVALLERRFMQGVKNFSRARAKTLDALAVGYLTTLLPGSDGYTNLFYGDAEVDGLVRFEDVVVVVEGKGTGLSVAAKRGDVTRLLRDITRAVEDGWVQGARAREYFLGDSEAVFYDEDGTEVVRIAKDSINEVIIVNPTIHELAGHAPQLPRLQKLGLFPDGEFPWSVYINDLRVIAETCENAAVFLHYLTWRSRLPLGERVTVIDELDLWGSYLLAERFGSLASGGTYTVGNAATDFDAYYAGVVGAGPTRPLPRKFLEEPAKGFVDRMARDRPIGWREAAGVILDLSLPELAFVCFTSRDAWREANATRSAVLFEAGRVRLIGVPRDSPVNDVIAETEVIESDVTFHIYVRGAKAKRGEVAWAKQLKPVTFELSEYEKDLSLRAKRG
jgi:hypothetical protein